MEIVTGGDFWNHVIGAVAGGIVGIEDILETADSGMQKILEWF